MNDVLASLAPGAATQAGVTVTASNALTYSALLAGVRILSESVASLPCVLYERRDEARTRAPAHPLYLLLHDAPNGRQTAFDFFEVGMAHLVLWGNFYAEIERNGRGTPLALWPLRPDRMTVDLDKVTGRRVYTYDNAPMGGERVLHITGLGGDGVVGYSLVRLARETIGMGLATQQFGAAFFANGATPSLVLKHPGEMSDKAYRRLKESWTAQSAGLANAHKPAILEEGTTIEKLTIPPEDAQFLDSRRFQVEEIARILRIPPHLMAMTDKAATYASVEQFAIQFVRDTIRPWLKRWEAALALQLLLPAERSRFYLEFLVDDLLRGDTQTRYQAYATARQWGWMSANDIRRLENMAPISGGDAYLQPLNMVSAGATRMGEHGRNGRTWTQVLAERRAEDTAPRARMRIAEIMRPQLVEAAQRILNREYNDIGQAARTLLARRGRGEFEEWMNQFATDHLGFVSKHMRGPVLGMGNLAADAAAQEVGEDATPDVGEFGEDYLNSRSAKWVAALNASVRAALYPDDESDGHDALAAVQEALQKRKDEEADDWARDQAVRIVNAFAVVTWSLLGWLMLRWMSFGENCDFCSGLNGRTIGIQSWFALAGEGIEGGEGKAPLRPGSNVRHPPLHDGCDCMVVPG